MPERGDAERASRTGLRGAVSAGLLAALVAASLGIIAGHEGMDPAASGDVATSASSEPTAPSVPSLTEVEDGASPTPRPAQADGEPREPTDADADAFLIGFAPQGVRDAQSVIVDLDDDGRPEVLVASLAGPIVRLDVAVWDGRSYAVAFTDPGGPAEEIVAFGVRDVTGDGQREIIIEQSSESRDSIALWGVAPAGEGETEPAPAGPRIVRLHGRGGCWNDAHVFGFTGATVDEGELVASCDPSSDEDLVSGTAHRYTWDGQAWIYAPSEDP